MLDMSRPIPILKQVSRQVITYDNANCSPLTPKSTLQKAVEEARILQGRYANISTQQTKLLSLTPKPFEEPNFLLRKHLQNLKK